MVAIAILLHGMPSSPVKAAPLNPSLAAAMTRALARSGFTPAKHEPVYALAGPAQHPTQVLFDATASHQSAVHLYRARVTWNGSTARIGKVNDLTPGQGVSVAAEAASGGQVFLLAALDSQIQTLQVVNLQSGRRKVFSFTEPVGSAHLATRNDGGVLVAFHPQTPGAGLQQVTLTPNAKGWRVSPAQDLQSVAQANNQSLFINIVEAVRKHMGSPVVAALENVWYSAKDQYSRLTYGLFGAGAPKQPSAGVGTVSEPSHSSSSPTPSSSAPVVPTHILPGAKASSPSSSTQPAQTPPPVSVPSNWPKLPGEGIWHTLKSVGSQPVIAETFVKPDPSRPYAYVELVWMDTRYLNFHLVAGTQEPVSPTGIRGPGEIPPSPSVRQHVVAAFNSGFKTVNGHFGEMVNHVVYLPPIKGLATFGIYQNQSVRLGSWGNQINWSKQLVSFRQNLPLLIDNHQVNPHINDMQYWGVTVNNEVHVYRSGLAITPPGNLVYASGVGLTARTLADAFQTAHVVNAMELDINSYWTTYNLYHWVGSPTGGHLVGSKLLSSMTRPADRYLTPDTRDFVYVTLNPPAGK